MHTIAGDQAIVLIWSPMGKKALRLRLRTGSGSLNSTFRKFAHVFQGASLRC